MSMQNIEDIYPLSPMQQGMLFHSLYAPVNTGVYFEQTAWVLRGDLDIPAFRQAWQQVLDRHTALRTSFLWEDLDEPLQVVHKQLQLVIDVQDWRDVLDDDPDRARMLQEQRLKEFLSNDRDSGFDLSEAPLMRLALFQISSREYYFVWSHHHLLLDGWSQPIIFQDVFRYYEANLKRDDANISTGATSHRANRDLPSVNQTRQSIDPARPRPYRDYIAWLQNQDMQEAQKFWQGVLNDFETPTSLVGDIAPRKVEVEGKDDYYISSRLVSQSTSENLQRMVRENQLTLNTVMQGAWGILLSRYSGEEDVVYGATVSGRPPELPGSEGIVGLFINTLPVRLQIDPQANVIEWLGAMQAQQAQSRQFEFAPLFEIQTWSEVPRDMPLFESLLVFENYPVDEVLDQAQTMIQFEKMDVFTRTNYPMTVAISPGKQIGIEIAYDAGRFSQGFIDRMLDHFIHILAQIAGQLPQTSPSASLMKDGDLPTAELIQPQLVDRADTREKDSWSSTRAEKGLLADVEILTSEEKQRILLDWNQTEKSYPLSLCVHELIEAQVSRAPERIALEYKGQKVSYSELNQKANRIAHYLQGLGVGPEILVGVSLPRSFDVIVAMLGVMKAGGAYVPLDATYPIDRLEFMVRDSGMQVLITRSDHPLTKSLSHNDLSLSIVHIDQDWEQFSQEKLNLEQKLTPDNLVNVIYTSGSTGVPKGVAVRHQSFTNHTMSFADLLEITHEDRVMQFISLSFDASAEEIYPFLIRGATIVLTDAATELLGADIIRFCDHHKLTVMVFATPIWHQCIEGMLLEGLEMPRSLRAMVVGGESPLVEKAVTWARLAEARPDNKPMMFYNMYGPTETTVAATALKVPAVPSILQNMGAITIGKPLPNTKVYILDKHLQPVPVGVPGELCIGGIGVARGYLHRPELTSERFILNPFLDKRVLENSETEEYVSYEERIYRTGDLARLMEDGNIEFLGRLDQQVKLRGFRVELGEVETVLRNHAEIMDAVAVLREDIPGDKQLVAYLVPEIGETEISTEKASPGLFPSGDIDHQALKDYMKGYLPDYMIPSIFVQLEALPLTLSGKLDRKALPVPAELRLFSQAGYIPPRTAIEEIIAGLWSEVLGVENIGVYENFFDLGGHSLKATQLLSRLRQTFEVDLSLRDIFEAPTIDGIASQLTYSKITGGIEMPPIQPLPRDEDNGTPISPPPLSFAQQRLWFLDQLDPGNLAYNIPMFVRVTGKLDIDALGNSLNQLVRRHEALRTTFDSLDGKPIQVINANLELPEMPIVVLDRSQVKSTRAESVKDTPVEIVPENAPGTSTRTGQDRPGQARTGPGNYLGAETQEGSSLFSMKSLGPEVIAICQEEVKRPFDLHNGPLIRAKLIRLDEQEHIFILVLHHIVSDGWSLGILVRELASFYEAYTSEATTEPSIPDKTRTDPGTSTPDRTGTSLEQAPGQARTGLGTSTDLKIQYADFAAWQRDWMQGEPLEKQLGYWKAQLAGLPPVLDLPTDHPRPPVKTANGASKSFILPKSLSEKISGVCRDEGVTTYMLLLAAFQALLHRYCGQDDIPVGSVIANRNHRSIEGLIGFFVNTLVMRGDFTDNPTFRECLYRTRNMALGAYAHQDMPFEMLVEELQPERNLSYSPIFQVGFDFQDAPVKGLDLKNLNFHPLDIDSGTTPYDLLLSVTQSSADEDGKRLLSGALEYNTDLFEEVTIDRLIGHFQTLLSAAVDDPDIHISNLPLLSPTESHQLLVEWNLTGADYDDAECIHQRFEYWVEKSPDRIALSFENNQISYAELNRRANQLAHSLRSLGVGADTLVGISTERSIEMIVGILGVLKASGAYLPLDPAYPVDRLTYMIQDSQIKILLTQEHLISSLSQVISASDVEVQVICLDRDWSFISNHPQENLVNIADPENLAYVIYTSGSTGRPKGAMLRHRGLCNLAQAQRIAFEIDENSRVLQFSPFSFDASVWETFMALANGACLCLARQEMLASGLDLVRVLKDQAVTTVTLPPSMLSVIPEQMVSIEEMPQLRTVIAAGEACTREIVQHWAPGRRFFNAYGPTETTVCASMAVCSEGDPEEPSIGRPIANTQLYILDKYLQPVPVGVPGELCVGGVSVARGYLGRGEKTAESFVPDTFRIGFSMDFETGIGMGTHPERTGTHPEMTGTRLYRTGDLVRYRSNGDIEFLGRIDYQVKVRGHRIELGEVETVLRGFEHPEYVGLRDAVAIVREDLSPGDKRIVAYVIPDTVDQLRNNWEQPGMIEAEQAAVDLTANKLGSELKVPDSGVMRSYLRQFLPEYMIPSAFVVMDEFPLSPSGKVDRRTMAALPAPEIGRQELKVPFVAPRNPVETKLVEISADLLGTSTPIGIHDNFFELGGHSLLATQFISRVREVLGVELPLRTLFEHPTIAEIALAIEQSPPAVSDLTGAEPGFAGAEPKAPTIQRVARESRRMKRSDVVDNPTTQSGSHPDDAATHSE